MTVPSRLPNKKDVILMMLETSDVFVHIDPRKDLVTVPPNLRKQPQLVLQIGLNMPVPIPDLDVGDEGIGCTLSFSHTPFWCFLPWTAVFAMVSDDRRGMVWPDDVPVELSVQFLGGTPQRAVRDASAEPQPAARKPSTKKRADPKKTPRARPSPVAEARDNAELQPQAAPPSKPKRELPPYLRVVK